MEIMLWLENSTARLLVMEMEIVIMQRNAQTAQLQAL